jgi:hypothetical protein
VVVLPAFVRAHRAGFEYELTPPGSSAAAQVSEDGHNDRFTVTIDRPHVKVAWCVTALRDEGGSGSVARDGDIEASSRPGAARLP